VNQGVLDAEDRVLVEQFVAADEDVGDEGAVAGRGDHEVQVGGPVWAAPGGLEQVADRPVVGDGVIGGEEAPEAELAFLVGEEVGAAVDAAIVVLHVVEAFLVGLPHLDAGAGDGLAGDVRDGALDPGRLAGGAAGHVAAVLDERGVLDEEGAEHGGLGGVLVGLVVHGDGLHGDAEHVAEQHELLPVLGGDVADAGEELDRGVPLGLGEPHRAHVRVEVRHELLQQVLRALVGGVVKRPQDAGDEVFLAGGLLG
jgi:hypothetical protein